MSDQQSSKELPTEERAIVDSVSSQFGSTVRVAYARTNRIKFTSEPQSLVVLARFLKNNLHFDHCTNVTGTDFPKENQIQVDYHFGSIDGNGLRRIIIALSCRVPYESPKVPSLIEEYPSVEFHEREAFEMVGVEFTGHPNLSRLLLPEDWNDIPPMLKRYRLPGRLEGE